MHQNTKMHSFPVLGKHSSSIANWVFLFNVSKTLTHNAVENVCSKINSASISSLLQKKKKQQINVHFKNSTNFANCMIKRQPINQLAAFPKVELTRH